MSSIWASLNADAYGNKEFLPHGPLIEISSIEDKRVVTVLIPELIDLGPEPSSTSEAPLGLMIVRPTPTDRKIQTVSLVLALTCLKPVFTMNPIYSQVVLKIVPSPYNSPAMSRQLTMQPY